MSLMIPDAPGLPVWWWVAWLVIALVLYVFLAIWFTRVARRCDAEQARSAASGQATPTSGGA